MRLLPLLEEARRDAPDLLRCETCMTRTTTIERQMMRCGHEPALVGVERLPDGRDEYRGIVLQTWRSAEVCAGYVTALPEVAEVTRCYLQWEAGTLEAYLDGQQPSRPLLEALSALQIGIRETQVDPDVAAARSARAKREAAWR